MRALVAILATTVFLAACGGGGGAPPAVNVTPAVTSTPSTAPGAPATPMPTGGYDYGY